MKLRKRIVAMFTAMMMAVSMMSIGASAYPDTSNWPSFHVHYANYAPSSENVTSQTLTTHYYGGYLTITTSGQVTVDTYISSLSNATATFRGFAYFSGLPTKWAQVVSFTRSTSGFDTPHTNYYPNAYVGSRAKVVVELNYSSSSTYSNAQGKATAY